MKKQEENADEKALGKIVAAKLREQLGGGDAGCAGAETLAAYYDRSLSDRERAACEQHLLTCLRCQEYLAELARLTDSDEPPRLVERELSEEADDAARGWTFPLAWVVPFLVIAIGSGIWYREEIDRWIHRPQETAMTLPEPAPAPETPAETRARDVAVKKEEPARSPAADQFAKTIPPPAPARAPGADEGLRQKAAGAPSAARVEAGSGAIAPPSARADLRASAKTLEQDAGRESKDQMADHGAAVPAAAQSIAAPPSTIDSFARREAAELSGVTVRGAQPKFIPKWRVGTGGTIQKAEPSGDWVRVPSGVSADLFAITFAGDAGWVVGHNGVVLRSTDGGNTWLKVASPTTEALVHVSAQSAQEAQVISRSGKTYSTADGGRTWQ
jgi:hypothetical protein